MIPRWSRITRRLALVSILLAAPLAAQPGVGNAALPVVASLKHLTLEELLTMDVTSVSRRPEPFATVASALSVLTGDDVRRSGALTLADALRFSTGLEVARIDGRTWGIAARGFNNNASNKLLVMMDGRSLYTPLFSGVFWDVQDTELADLDRIEIVRGPGATMWGANAVNGVINIQTKSARDTQGTAITVGGGTEDRGFASVRHGLQLGAGTFARVYAKTYRRDDMAFPNGTAANDDAQMNQAGFRIDGEPSGSPDAWTAQGDYYHGFLGGTNRVATRVAGGNLLGRERHAFGPDQMLTTQIYYDRVERFVPGQFRETRDSFDFDTQFNAPLGPNQDFVAGLAARSSSDRTGNDGTVRFIPADRRMDVYSAFVQDEFSFAEHRAGVTLGAKLENNDSTGFEFQPSVRGAWHPTPEHTLWAAVSRAVRTPTRFDDDLRFGAGPPVVISGSHDFLAEEVIAYEAGYRAHVHTGWALDLSFFVNRYDHLRSQERSADPAVLFVLRNKLNGETRGGEISVLGEITPTWRLRATYAHLYKRLTLDPGSTDITGGALEGNDPRHLGTLVSSWDLPAHLELDALLRATSALPNPVVPGYTELDLRAGWRPTAAWEFSLAGQNLLHPRHREFGPATGPTARALERNVYGKVTWRF